MAVEHLCAALKDCGDAEYHHSKRTLSTYKKALMNHGASCDDCATERDKRQNRRAPGRESVQFYEQAGTAQRM